MNGYNIQVYSKIASELDSDLLIHYYPCHLRPKYYTIQRAAQWVIDSTNYYNSIIFLIICSKFKNYTYEELNNIMNNTFHLNYKLFIFDYYTKIEKELPIKQEIDLLENQINFEKNELQKIRQQIETEVRNDIENNGPISSYLHKTYDNGSNNFDPENIELTEQDIQDYLKYYGELQVTKINIILPCLLIYI